MAENSKIEWTESTWNPIRGCSVVNPGCKNCYAMKQEHRFYGKGQAYEGLTQLTSNGPVWTGKVKFVPEHLADPLKWREPRRIFVNSMSDLFHEGIALETLDKIFAVMALCPQHTFQILTKHPKYMNAYVYEGNLMERLGFTASMIWHVFKYGGRARDGEKAAQEVRQLQPKFPLSNVWMGVSCENQKAKDRIAILREAPAAVRMLSLEPLLEDLGQLDLRGIHWVIVGGESGPGARPMHPDWARSLRDQCKAAGVPYFFKQWGEWVAMERGKPAQSAFKGVPEGSVPPERVKWMQPDGRVCPIGEGGYAGDYVREGTLILKVGKKAAGRLLDGKEHNEYPEVHP